MSRAPFEVVTKGLNTTSEKIRALARAGYLRTEINKLLDIRYQQVRKVLVDAGIGIGMQRIVELERSSDIIEAPESERKSTPPAVLLQSGFVGIGEWRLAADQLVLDGRAPAEAGVYAFVLGDEVEYIGVTQNGLRARMEQYRRGHEGQKTNARVNALIRESLAGGDHVRAIIAVPPPSDWNGCLSMARLALRLASYASSSRGGICEAGDDRRLLALKKASMPSATICQKGLVVITT